MLSPHSNPNPTQLFKVSYIPNVPMLFFIWGSPQKINQPCLEPTLLPSLRWLFDHAVEKQSLLQSKHCQAAGPYSVNFFYRKVLVKGKYCRGQLWVFFPVFKKAVQSYPQSWLLLHGAQGATVLSTSTQVPAQTFQPSCLFFLILRQQGTFSLWSQSSSTHGRRVVGQWESNCLAYRRSPPQISGMVLNTPQTCNTQDP